MEKTGAFDVFGHMARTNNKALRFAPMSNVDSIDYKSKRGTSITIGISPDNIALDFQNSEFVGGFLYVKREEFEKAKAGACNSHAKLVEALKALLSAFIDDPCTADHHGNCQAHFVTPVAQCPVNLARKALKEAEAL